MLKAIKEKLEEFKTMNPLLECVNYGLLTSEVKDWNYIVFSRLRTSPSESRKNLTDRYIINLIMETAIPEETVPDLINKLQEIHGLVIDGDINYNYTRKNNSDVVIEIASITMKKARKGI